jgi:membrane protein
MVSDSGGSGAEAEPAGQSAKPLLLDPRALFELFRDAYSHWRADSATRMAAALAYYTLFSLAPLLLIAVGAASQLFGADEARAAIIGQIRSLAGPSAAEAVQAATKDASQNAAGTAIAATIGVVTLLVGATNVFRHLQLSLDTMWGIRLDPEAGLVAVLRRHFMSFALFLVIGFLLLVSLIFSAIVAAISNEVSREVPVLLEFLPLVDLVLSTASITILFGLSYKLLPSVRIAWRDVWTGAAVTAVLFTAGKVLIGLYLGNSRATSAYGATGSILVILIWVYYSAQIFLFGAEFTYVYANRYGSKIQPGLYALPIEEHLRTLEAVRRRAIQVRDEALAPPSAGRGAYLAALAAFLAGIFIGVATNRSNHSPDK